jgi:peptidoglycan hydrolase-like protein with peptidoglycan-binding domain
MSKAGLVIAAWVVIASGCAFVDSPQTEINAVEETAASAAFEPVSSVGETQLPTMPSPPAVVARSLAADEIRRMQVRLRDVGLDPGPVDGVTGGKTKTAAKRFLSGCVELQEMLDSRQGAAMHKAALNKMPNRQETLAMQQQLRSAGFNPGPADGIFGAKMRSVVTHLQNGCPAAQEFVTLIDQTAADAPKLALPAVSPGRPSAPRAATPQNLPEAAKQLAVPAAVRPQEDVRILQLRLRDAGYDPGPFDGVMGPKTKLALQQMQASQRSGKAKTTVTARAGTQY